MLWRRSLSSSVNRLGPLGDLRLDLPYVEVIGSRVDVHEGWHSTETGDRAHSRKETVRRRDDLVAGLHVERHQGEQQRIAARCTADGVFCTAIGCEFLFKRLNLAP